MAAPLNATFFAFRKREKGLLLGASLTFAVIMLVLGAIVSVGGAMLLGMGPMGFISDPGAAQDPSFVQNAMTGGGFAGFILLYIAFMFAFFIALAAYEAACLRWMIRGERRGLFGLTLDGDTWRVYGTYWMWFVFAILGYIALIVLVIIFGLIGGGIAAASDSPLVPGVLALVGILIFISLPIWLCVRLAPAAAISVGKAKFAVMDAWKVTKGRFWSLFGAYFLVWLIYTIVIFAIWGVAFGSMFMSAFQAGGGMSGDPSAFSQRYQQAMMDMLRSPGAVAIYWGVQAVNYVLWLVFAVLGYGINARAVIAAAEEGKVDGVVSTGLAQTFE